MTIAEFIAKYASSGSGNFRTGQTRGIGSDDMREFATDISTLSDLRVYNLNRLVSKSGHGFAVKNVITLNSSGVHVKVSDPDADKFVGIVTEVPDANSFRIHTAGYVTGLSGLTAGAVHYAQSDGTLSTTESAMPVLFADSTSSGYILASAASASSGIRSGDASEGEEGVYTLTLDPAITEYTDGAAFLIRFDISSINGVGEDTTLNINSLGAKSIRRYPGVRLIPGDINNVQHYFVTYNESSDQFQVHHLPFLPNSVTNKASYVDILGRFRIAQGSTYDASSQAWTHTGTDDGDTELVKFQNDSQELIFRLLNSKTAEFGNNGSSILEIPDSINSGNSYFLINNGQQQAYVFRDKLGNNLLTFKTIDNEVAPVLHGLEKQFTNDFRTVTKQVHAFASDDDPEAQNVLATIPVPSGSYVHLRLKTAIAWSDSGQRMISTSPLVAIGFNTGSLEGTAESSVPVYHGGPSTGGFNINFNSSSGEVEIRLENEETTGHVFVCDLEYEYTLIAIPA